MTRTITTLGARAAIVVVTLGLVMALGVLAKNEPGITFATGGLNLKIDSSAWYNGAAQPALSWSLKNLVPGVDKFFNFDDIKPGDSGKTIISLHPDQKAWACLQFKNFKDEENGENEPESLEDLVGGALDGELAEEMEFFAWFDDGDNNFEGGEKPIFGTTTQSAVVTIKDKKYVIADALNGPAINAGQTKYVGIMWCAGDLSVNLATGATGCNGEVLGNAAQTDSMSVDVEIFARTANDSPTFGCNGDIPPPPKKGLKFYMEKKFSGPHGTFTENQFSFRIYGNGLDVTIPHGGYVELRAGTYAIEEVVPPGFDLEDWTIQWSGDTCKDTDTDIGSITVKEKDITKLVTSYCWADNQYRPKNNKKPLVSPPASGGSGGNGNNSNAKSTPLPAPTRDRNDRGGR